MRLYKLSFMIFMLLATLLGLFRLPQLRSTGAECLQLTDALYNRTMIELSTGKQIGKLGGDDYANYSVHLSPDRHLVFYLDQEYSKLVYTYQLFIRPANVV